MAVEATYTEQMPFSGTPTQKRLLDEEAAKRRVSKAHIIRQLLDAHYGLVDGQYPQGTARSA